jgi:hypothetical protein
MNIQLGIYQNRILDEFDATGFDKIPARRGITNQGASNPFLDDDRLSDVT